MKRLLPSLLAVLIAVPLIACSDDEETEEPDEFGSLTISDQELEEPDEVTIDEVVSVGPGAVVIYEDDGGDAGDELGRVDVDDGEASDLTVELSRAIEGEEEALLGSLYDEEEDLALDEEGDVIMAYFTATYEEEEEPEEPASLSIDDQELDAEEADQITVAEVVAREDGSVAIYEDDGGEAGDEVGSVDVDAGESSDLTVELSRDAEDDEMFYGKLLDGAGDVVEYDEQEVMDSFTVTIEEEEPEPEVTASVTAEDQTTDDESADWVTVAEASISEADGFVVIHEDDDGPGDVIGYEFIEDGEHEDVEVELDEALELGETTLHAMIHVDDPADQDFTFGENDEDPPVLDENDDPIMDEFTVEVVEADETTIEASDQILEAKPLDVVTVDTVIYDGGDAWVVIKDTGDQKLGKTLLDGEEDDVFNDIEVQLDDDVDGERELTAKLYEEVEPEGELDLGEDDQIEVDGTPVEDDFTVDLVPNEITVSDPQIGEDDLSTVITIDEVQTRQDGVILEIFADAEDDLLLGEASFDYGIHDDIEVILDRPLADEEELSAELIATDDEVLADASFEADVHENAAAVKFTVSYDGGFEFDAVEPATFDGLVDETETNPELTVYEDWRYTFDYSDYTNQPLEFIYHDGGGLLDPGSEHIYLAYDASENDGTLNEDGDVAWTEDDQIASFNLHEKLYDIGEPLNAYRSSDSEEGGDIDPTEAPALRARD